MAAARVCNTMGSVLSVAAFLLLLGPVVAYGFQFQVGGTTGWIEPAGEKDVYNDWARRNRFHVGDSLYFKYTDDSVLVVEQKDYDHCNTANPLQEFTDGNTTFTFRHFGFFYFISGNSGHCKSGQRLVVRVMVHKRSVPAASPPTPPPRGGHDADSAPAPAKTSVAPPGGGDDDDAGSAPAPAKTSVAPPGGGDDDDDDADSAPAPAKTSVPPPGGGGDGAGPAPAPAKSSSEKKSFRLWSALFMALFIVSFIV